MAEDGSKARQLSFSPIDKYAPSWCSDNQVLHFETARGESTFVDIETGRTRTAFPSLSAPLRGPFGDVLPFEREGRIGRTPAPWPNCGPEELREVVALRSPEALPEGILVAVEKSVGADEKTRFDLRVVEANRLDDVGRGRAGAPASLDHRVLSKDGEAAFLSNREGAFEVWRAGSDGARVRLTDLGVDVGSLSWSSDGRFIYFGAAPEGIRQIFRVSADGSELVQLTHEKTPSRSPVFASPIGPNR
jgi:hypothetical protein